MANLGHNPEVEDVDAGVALAGNGVDRQVEGPCPAAPRQTRLARISFDGGDELVGDFGVKIAARPIRAAVIGGLDAEGRRRGDEEVRNPTRREGGRR